MPAMTFSYDMHKKSMKIKPLHQITTWVWRCCRSVCIYVAVNNLLIKSWNLSIWLEIHPLFWYKKFFRLPFKYEEEKKLLFHFATRGGKARAGLIVGEILLIFPFCFKLQISKTMDDNITLVEAMSLYKLIWFDENYFGLYVTNEFCIILKSWHWRHCQNTSKDFVLISCEPYT